MMIRHLYAAYFTGIAGTSFGMFLIGDGLIVGADEGGLKYDGVVKRGADGALEGIVTFTVPRGAHLIGGISSEQEQSFTIGIRLEKNFDDGEMVTRIETPVGPVNARFERLREVP